MVFSSFICVILTKKEAKLSCRTKSVARSIMALSAKRAKQLLNEKCFISNYSWNHRNKIYIKPTFCQEWIIHGHLTYQIRPFCEFFFVLCTLKKKKIEIGTAKKSLEKNCPCLSLMYRNKVKLCINKSTGELRMFRS